MFINKTEQEYDAHSDPIHYFYTILLVPVGIVTNLLAFLVYGRQELNKTSAGILNQCIALSNMFILLFHLLVVESTHTFGMDVLTMSDWSCKLFRLVKKVTRETSPSVEVLLILTRYIEVFYPRKFSCIQKKQFLVKLVALIYLVLLVINIENLFYFKRDLLVLDQQQQHSVNNLTRSKCDAHPVIIFLSELISALFRSLLPSSIMFILNVLIIKRLFRSKSLSSRQTSHLRRVKGERELKFTFTVLLRNILFILLNLPYTIMSMCRVYHFMFFSTYSSQIDVYSSISYDISTFYYISFFFMNLVFNKLFLKETIDFVLMRSDKKSRYYLAIKLEQNNNQLGATLESNKRNQSSQTSDSMQPPKK